MHRARLGKSGTPFHRSTPSRRRRARVIVVVLLALLVWPAGSLTWAVTRPGTDPMSAKAAEWARGHGLGFLVTAAEEAQYRAHPPRVGGTPDPSLLEPTATAPAASNRVGRPVGRPGREVIPSRTPMPTPVRPALSGEGVFRTVAATARGPAVQLAYVRPDSAHTSYLAAVLVMDPRLVRFVQHPGYDEPGRLPLWSVPDSVPSRWRATVAATFNGGFKLRDARGGYYSDGHVVGTLRTGAASEVTTKSGALDVGSWNHEVRMGPQVASVRQNLQLLVDHGAVVASVNASTQSVWGATIGGGDFVWRSGVGVDRRGDVIDVVGPALSAGSLARILAEAGAVRAMQLDINPTWISAMWYSHPAGTAVPHKVLPFRRPSDRYLTPTSRDFVAAYLR